MEIIQLKDENFFAKNSDSISKRNELRKLVIDLFGTENPGEGTGDKASRYEYIFEDIYTKNHDKYNIYIQRPANLHNRL